MFKKSFLSLIAFTFVCWSLAWVFSAMAGETPKGTVKKLQARFNQAQPVHEVEALDLVGVENISISTKSFDVSVELVSDGNPRVEFSGNGDAGKKLIQLQRAGNELKISIDQTHGTPSFVLFSFDADEEKGDFKVSAFRGLKILLPADLRANLRIESLSGDLDVSGLNAKSFAINTMSGDVKIGGCSAAELARVETKSGDIDIRGFKGKLITSTNSGELSGSEISGESVEARSTSGDIELKSFAAGALRAEATSGDISVALPEPKGWKFTLSATSGDIRNEFPDDKDASKVMQIRSTSGDIKIHR